MEAEAQTKEMLFERLLDYNVLYKAFKLVKANKGAPGIDNQTIPEFESKLKEELTKLQQDLVEWKYRPSPVRRVEIPKPGSKELRGLGIPTVRDRVVQQAIRQLIETRFELEFSESSFGFRPGRGQQDALKQAKRYVLEEGREWIVDIDLEKYFDTINHDRLITRLREKVKDGRIIKLIVLTLKSGIMLRGEVEASEKGAPQGSPLSPLLSNIYLNDLDKELEQRGAKFCRYADDCNIYVRSEKTAKRVMESVGGFIEKKLKLKVNRTKSKVAKSDKVKFLGFRIVSGKLAIAEAPLNKALEKIKKLIPRRTHVKLGDKIEEINQWYRGWGGYFKQTDYKEQLGGIEAHIRRRLRAHIVARYKTVSTLKRKLGRHVEVPSKRNRGIWSLSISRAVQMRFSNKWFKQQGLHTFETKECKLNWAPLDKWLATI